MDQAQDTTPDFGQKADDRPHGFSQPWLDEFNKSPYIAPGDLVVAGDDSRHGQRLSGTFLDDGRAKLPWSQEHEGIVQSMLSAPVRVRLHGFALDARGERIPVLDAAGKQEVNGAGFPQWKRETKEIATFPSLILSVYLMGHSGNKKYPADWYPAVGDGRQRRDAALEMQRRLDWCAAVLSGAVAGVRDSKPGMRNLLVKLGKDLREKYADLIEAIDGTAADAAKQATDASQNPSADQNTADPVDPIAAAWAAVVAEHVAQLPTAPAHYEAWCLQGEPQTPRQLDGQPPLYWLDENFAKLFVGSDALGDHSKGGWVVREKADEAGGAHYQIRGALQAHLTCKVVGENPDLTDPKPLLDSVCSKTVSVKMAPSQIARNLMRVLAALKNPRDPSSGPLFSEATVLARAAISKGTFDDYKAMVGQYEPDVQQPDGSVIPGARHGGMCDEVLELIDSGQMSMAFALSERDSVFVKWPKGKVREALPYDLQRLILAHLYAKIPAGAGGEVRFSGEASRAIGTALRNLALQGKLGPVGYDGDEDDAETPAPLKPTKGAPDKDQGDSKADGGGKADGAKGADGGGAKGADSKGGDGTKADKGKARAFDADAFRARIAQAVQSAPPAERSSRSYSAADLASLVGSVVLHVRGGADLDFDALPDEHRETLRALLAPVAAAPAVPENVLLGDWIAVALDGAVAEVRDFRPGAVTTETTAANGAKPTPAQAEKANSLIKAWLDEYAAGGDAVSAQTFEDHCVLKIGALSA